MPRIATTFDGQLCARCNGFLSSSSTGTLTCSCPESLLTQYDSESESDGKLVRDMLFMQRMADDVSVPMEKRIEYANNLKALYKEHLELAARNAVRSPFSSGFRNAPAQRTLTVVDRATSMPGCPPANTAHLQT